MQDAEGALVRLADLHFLYAPAVGNYWVSMAMRVSDIVVGMGDWERLLRMDGAERQAGWGTGQLRSESMMDQGTETAVGKVEERRQFEADTRAVPAEKMAVAAGRRADVGDRCEALVAARTPAERVSHTQVGD